jgi:hypothetical protein
MGYRSSGEHLRPGCARTTAAAEGYSILVDPVTNSMETTSSTIPSINGGGLDCPARHEKIADLKCPL